MPRSHTSDRGHDQNINDRYKAPGQLLTNWTLLRAPNWIVAHKNFQNTSLFRAISLNINSLFQHFAVAQPG